jgi:sensor histidine kinase YesM
VVRLLIGVALIIGLLDTVQWLLGYSLRGVPTTWRSVADGFGNQFLPWCWLALLLVAVVRATVRWPIDGERWRANLAPHLVAMVIFALVHIAGAVIAGAVFATGPVDYRAFTLKLLLFRFPIDVLIYWSAVGVVQAARAAATAREREQRAARLEASLVEVELAALRDRLDPHFVFNTLNAVSTLALRRDHDGVIRIVEAMSDLLRVSLSEGRGQEAPLERELAFLDRYLEIEQLRFGDRLTVERSVAAGLERAVVPVMLIQPLVENAIRHGAGVKPGPVTIRVRILREGDAVAVEIADTGPGFGRAPAGNGSGIGLASCRARLTGLYGARGTVSVADAPGGGALVTARFPYRPAVQLVPS